MSLMIIPSIPPVSERVPASAPKRMEPRIQTRFASTDISEEKGAVAAIRAQLLESSPERPPPTIILFFCSPKYALDVLAQELTRAFEGITIVGCTSSGQIDGNGFHKGGISAMSIEAKDLRVVPYLMNDLAARCEHEAEAVASRVTADRSSHPRGWKSFGLLLVDGLSRSEERLSAALYCALGDIPIVGGSAGDDLAFEQTHIFVDGVFHSDAGMLLVFSTPIPFSLCKIQHFAGSERMLVVTAADTATRTIFEIDGEVAAEAYARLLGLPLERLDSAVCSAHPLVLEIDGEPYVRSIAKINPDGSLTLFCAVDEGTVLSIGAAVDPMTTLETAFERVRARVEDPSVIIGCDCILRRIEFESRGMSVTVGELLARNRVFGFSTYGEQFNGIHVNQTFTGVVIGK